MAEQEKLAPTKIFDHIINQFPLNSVKRLYDCITTAICSLSPAIQRQDAYILADKVENAVRSQIDDQIEEYRRRKIPPKIYFSSLDDNRLIGRCFEFTTDSDEAKIFKRKLLLMKPIQESLTGLTWNEFEKFCIKFTATQPKFSHVRKKIPDCGIDFHGNYLVSSTHSVRFGGQSKKYGLKRRIGPNIIRELEGSIHNYEYAFGIMMATCLFTAGSRKYARRKNMETLDGEQIAYRLIQMNVGIIMNGDDPSFSDIALKTWVKNRHAN